MNVQGLNIKALPGKAKYDLSASEGGATCRPVYMKSICWPTHKSAGK